MLSEEKECIRFVKPIDPAKKNVEDWMNELEQQMKVSVKSVLRKGIELYPASKRTQWVLEHPGQVVLNASQVFWTKELEDAIL
jgi:dynein heavy chain, axonemal